LAHVSWRWCVRCSTEVNLRLVSDHGSTLQLFLVPEGAAPRSAELACSVEVLDGGARRSRREGTHGLVTSPCHLSLAAPPEPTCIPPRRCLFLPPTNISWTELRHTKPDSPAEPIPITRHQLSADQFPTIYLDDVTPRHSINNTFQTHQKQTCPASERS